jgi:hypothetical protein
LLSPFLQAIQNRDACRKRDACRALVQAPPPRSRLLSALDFFAKTAQAMEKH